MASGYSSGKNELCMETNLRSSSGLNIEAYVNTDVWLKVCHSDRGWAQGSRSGIGLAAPYRHQEGFHPRV